jgi:hypothetical protein
LKTGERGFDFQHGQRFLFSSPSYRLVRVRRPRREAAHSPQSSAEVMNAWMCTCNLPYVFMACSVIKHRDQFTFFLLLSILLHENTPNTSQHPDCDLYSEKKKRNALLGNDRFLFQRYQIVGSVEIMNSNTHSQELKTAIRNSR